MRRRLGALLLWVAKKLDADVICKDFEKRTEERAEQLRSDIRAIMVANWKQMPAYEYPDDIRVCVGMLCKTASGYDQLKERFDEARRVNLNHLIDYVSRTPAP